MDPRSLKIRDLFEQECNYLIPIFQRGYVWERKTQWQPLWADICAQVERDRNDARRQTRRHRCLHFLGAVVLHAHESRTRQANRYEVIDGQQRITTLYLLLTALRDVADSQQIIARDSREDDISMLLHNRRVHDDQKYNRKLVPTAAFLPQLDEVSAAGALADLRVKYPLLRKNSQDPQGAGAMAACYLYFSGKIEAFLNGELVDADEETEIEGLEEMTPRERLDLFRESLLSGLHLVALHLDANDDPQAIFESLNARGIPLTPADLIRNHVFLSGLRAEEEVNQERLYNRYWSRFDAIDDVASPWRRLVKLGRIQMTQLDLYCYHFVVAVRGEIIPLKHLYPQFRDWWNDRSADKGFDATIGEFTGTADRYMALSTASGNEQDPVDRLARLLRDMDLSVAMPVVLAIEMNRARLQLDLAGICLDVSSYIVRRLFTGVQSQGFNRIIPSMIASLQEGGRAALQERMLSWRGQTMAWIADESFSRNWLSDATYTSLGPKRVNVVLRMLDKAMQDARNERLLVDQELTVEHVLPQSWSATDHPFPEGTDAQQQSVIRDQYLHNIGNLTLLTQSLNSHIQNGPFVTKRPKIAEQSALRLNVYFQTPPDGLEVWNENSIRRRAEGLLPIALKLWPRPSSAPVVQLA